MHMPIEGGRVIYANSNCIASAHGHASRGFLVNSIGIIEVEGAPRNAVKASIGTRLGSGGSKSIEAGLRLLPDNNKISQER